MPNHQCAPTQSWGQLRESQESVARDWCAFPSEQGRVLATCQRRELLGSLGDKRPRIWGIPLSQSVIDDLLKDTSLVPSGEMFISDR